MKVSYNWLKDFVDISETPQQVGARLTNLGLALDALDAHASDFVYELDVATNRPDCLSHLGVARELAAAYGAPLSPPQFDLREGEKGAAGVFSIVIDAPDLCARYCARYIAGVEVGPSPDWLKARLEALGLRSINNVADVTNYVMFELGQPLHGFDADTLDRRQVVVRRAELDERMTTLDGVDRELNPSMLVIADARRPIAIAGIMGGSETEISGATRNVLLESANFDPLAVRKTARALGLTSEASYRFERGADIEMASFACDRAAALIQMVAGGVVYRGVIDVYPRPRTPIVVELRRRRIAALLGAPVADEIVERILEGLGFSLERSEDGWKVQSPAHRVDVYGEEDLLDEIARHHGFDRFPSTLPKSSAFGSALPSEPAERIVRSHLAAAGFSEIAPMVFSNEADERNFRPEVEPVRLLNPMSEEEAILRTSQIPSMLRTIQWNVYRGIRDMQFYEIGKTYRRGAERRALILAATGAVRNKTVHETGREFDFFDMKGAVEELFETFGIDFQRNGAAASAYYHPGRVFRGALAEVGELHPDFAAVYKFRRPVYLAEIDLEAMFDKKQRRAIRLIPRYPAVRRDLSLLLTKGTRYSDVEQAVRAAGIAELARLEPFDRLVSPAFPDSKYALAVSLTYQSPDRTLTDEEVDRFNNRILESLRQRLGAELRQ